MFNQDGVKLIDGIVKDFTSITDRLKLAIELADKKLAANDLKVEELERKKKDIELQNDYIESKVTQAAKLIGKINELLS